MFKQEVKVKKNCEDIYELLTKKKKELEQEMNDLTERSKCIDNLLGQISEVVQVEIVEVEDINK